MQKIVIRELAKNFSEFANQTEDGIEFWYARDYQAFCMNMALMTEDLQKYAV